MHVACVRGSVLLRHVYDKPHRLSPGIANWAFFPIENALSAGKGGWECTAPAKYAIYDCLVNVHLKQIAYNGRETCVARCSNNNLIKTRAKDVYQTYTACTQAPKVPVTVHSRHPVNLGGDGMVPSGAARHLQHTAHALQCIVIIRPMASCFDFYSTFLLSTIRIVDRPTSNSNCRYQQFDFVNSRSNCW